MPLNTTLEIAEPTVLEQVKLIDAVAETEDKSPGDDRRNERCENLCGDGRCPLQDVLVPPYLYKSRENNVLNKILGLWQLLRIRDAYSTQNPRYASGRVLVRLNTCGFQTRCA
ncbi:hypothetical protein [Centipeda periodontii]|uniref:hypothetical protein n=1 Tax=Centipeda periodontii TaxID=82203 RepID=UPI0012B658B4|nr:hypothetical protein [Centipeda periodontii]